MAANAPLQAPQTTFTFLSLARTEEMSPPPNTKAQPKNFKNKSLVYKTQWFEHDLSPQLATVPSLIRTAKALPLP